MNHFDLAAVERQARAGVETATAQARARCKSEEERASIDIQAIAQELVVAGALVGSRMVNAGISANHAGLAIGSALGMVARSAGGLAGPEHEPEILTLVVAAFCEGLNAAQAGEAEGAVMYQEQIRPMQGGRA